jgi:hypothetical protein
VGQVRNDGVGCGRDDVGCGRDGVVGLRRVFSPSIFVASNGGRVN